MRAELFRSASLGPVLAQKSLMMKGDYNIELMRRIQETTRNCGVKLRSKQESDLLIKERLMQLEHEGKTDTKEYQFLSAIHERSC